jgi:4-hydroxybenzoate polyprenyltransferase
MVKKLSNRQILAIKLLGMLSLVRWYSILLIGLAQYLAAYFVFNPNSPNWLIIYDFKLHGIVLATAIIVAAGYIVNAFYDFEKDLVNKPDSTLFKRVISSNTALSAYMALNFIGLFVAFISSVKIFAFFLVLSFLLWLYSHKLQKIALLREISASLLSVSSFFSIALHFNRLDAHVFIFGSSIFTAILIREIVKEFIAKKGDAIFGYETYLIRFGESITKRTIAILALLSIPIPLIFYSIDSNQVITAVLVTVCIGYAISIPFVFKSEKQKQYERINTLYKWLIILQILCIPML